MDEIATIVEVAYRAACDWTTYTPEGIGSVWFQSVHVAEHLADDFMFVNDEPFAPLDDLDFEFAATMSTWMFPLPKYDPADE